MNIDACVQAARREADRSTYIYKLGAVVVRKGKVVGSGFNELKTHPKRNPDSAMFRHAEWHAIESASCDADTLVVIRVAQSGKLAMAKPCEDCLNHAREAKIKKVYYSDSKGNIVVKKINEIEAYKPPGGEE